MLTGKSADSDLLSRKKSLPVLFGLGKKGQFAKRWANGPINLEDIPDIASLLAAEGGRLFTQETADQMIDLAISSLRTADPKGDAGEALYELAKNLLIREA